MTCFIKIELIFSYQSIGRVVLTAAGKVISQLGSQKENELRLGGVMDRLLQGRESYTCGKSKVKAWTMVWRLFC